MNGNLFVGAMIGVAVVAVGTFLGLIAFDGFEKDTQFFELITLSLPDVYVSYSTGDCVKVVNYLDTTYACENIPNKFNHIWVE